MDAIHTKEYRGYTINVYPDDNSFSPREWENLGTMVTFSSEYKLGDEHDFKDIEELDIFLIKNKSIVLPLYAYIHGGVTMNTTGFSCHWDSGQVGYIYVTLEKVKEEYGWKVITKERRTKIEEYLRNEVKIFDMWLTGQVYGYTVETKDGDSINSCWGFISEPDSDELLSEPKSTIDYHINEKRKEHLKQLKTQIKNHVPLQYRKALVLV
tara:strand:- start:5439 stop:6068 length:630 start_codon:yes stop_codon:yes gene_type:complete